MSGGHSDPTAWLEMGEFRHPGQDPGVGPERSVRLSRHINSALVYAPLQASASLARLLPEPLALWLGAGLGAVVGMTARRARARALRHLRSCLDGEGVGRPEDLLPAIFRHFGREAFDLLRMGSESRAELDAKVRVRGTEHLEEARARAKGVILVAGHLGNWERLAAWVPGRMPFTVLARHLPNRHLNEWLVHLRAHHGVRTVYRGSLQSARECLRRLKEGEALGILIDQDTRVEGAFVPFFGKLAFTPTGAAGLAQRSGASLIPCFIHREGLQHEIVFEPPVPLDRGLEPAKARIAATAALTQRIEAAIQRHPDQWVWIHERFRTQPEDFGVSRDGHGV